MKEYEFHPLSELFPIIPVAEIKTLADDIKSNGMNRPITLYEGKILDGRHRYEACLKVGVNPVVVNYKGKDPLGFVISENLHRRHLDTGQRAIIAAKFATMRQGDRSDLEPSANLRKVDQSEPSANLPKVAQAEAAEKFNVSTRSVTTAAKIVDESPKLAAKVSSGEISLNAAAEKLAEKKAKTEESFDDVGTPIPKDGIPFWNRRNEVQKLLTEISRIKCIVEKAKEDGDCMFGKVSNSIFDAFNSVYSHLMEAKPYAVCTSCMGTFSIQPKGCSMCGNKGLISKFQWDSQSRKEIKEMRLKANAARK